MTTATAEHANFHILSSRLRLQGVLETKTALRIGSGGGGDMDASELPVLRDADGYPLIPGSSLKGVIRSTLEALIRGAGLDQGYSDVWTCDPLAEDIDKNPTCGRHKSGEGRREKALLQPHCAVCRLFGSRVIASHVRFSDLMLIDADSLKRRGRIPIEVRDGVAIDRDLRTARGGLKYDFEVIPPGTRFDLEVFVENPEDWLMGLLVMGFDQVSQGFSAIGGFTSRGLGRVSVRWTEMVHFDAKRLLNGGDATITKAEDIDTEFGRYRAEFAKRAKGEVGSDVPAKL